MIEIFSAVLVLAGLLIYVLLDGFDLGIGTFFAFAKNKKQKDEMMSSLAPIWDGNETWLIYAGGMAWAAFPLVYSIFLPAFYIPLTLMLFTLMFRGVSFEFRLKAEGGQKKIWDFFFFVGSFLTSFIQGAALGAIVNGIKVENNVYVGGAFDFLSLTSVATGIAVVVAHFALGCGWVIYKTEGETKDLALNLIKKSSMVLVALFAIIGIYLLVKYPFAIDLIKQKYLTIPLVLTSILSFAILCWIVFGTSKCLYKKDIYPFFAICFVIILSIANIVAVFWPYVIYPTHTLFDMANVNKSSLKAVFVLMLVMLPIILGYTIFVYRSFAGKISLKNNNNFYN
jgi:cytochrome d ubiquinol oxidase subunit II